MAYKIELLYSSSWDDAEWTEENDGVLVPLRFKTIADAEIAIDEFLASVTKAVIAGNMLVGHNRDEYRIVEAKR